MTLRTMLTNLFTGYRLNGELAAAHDAGVQIGERLANSFADGVTHGATATLQRRFSGWVGIEGDVVDAEFEKATPARVPARKRK